MNRIEKIKVKVSNLRFRKNKTKPKCFAMVYNFIYVNPQRYKMI